MIATRTLIFAAVAAALSSGISLAQDSKNQGYIVDSNSNIVTSPTTGLCWRSGDWTPARAVPQCDPVKVAQAPAAAPVTPQAAPPVAPPAKPAAAKPAPAKAPPQKISFAADTLFDFDKAVLKPEGKKMLDDLARDLQGAQYEIIVATGHTDRFGSNEYNQKLSERRAQAVKGYLVGREIPASRINAVGKGESEPVTKAGQCPGAKSAKVVACLQPDRRVDVEVTATKAPAAETR